VKSPTSSSFFFLFPPLLFLSPSVDAFPSIRAREKTKKIVCVELARHAYRLLFFSPRPLLLFPPSLPPSLFEKWIALLLSAAFLPESETGEIS